MKIIRYEDPNGNIQRATEQADRSYLRIEGTPLGTFRVIQEKGLPGFISVQAYLTQLF